MPSFDGNYATGEDALDFLHLTENAQVDLRKPKEEITLRRGHRSRVLSVLRASPIVFSLELNHLGWSEDEEISGNSHSELHCEEIC